MGGKLKVTLLICVIKSVTKSVTFFLFKYVGKIRVYIVVVSQVTQVTLLLYTPLQLFIKGCFILNICFKSALWLMFLYEIILF